MKKGILLPALILAGLAVGAIVGQGIEERHVTFTAISVENHYDAGGTPKFAFFETHSVWPDGSTEDVRHAVDGRPVGMRKINDLGRGVRTVLDTGTSSRTSYTISPPEVQRAKSRVACSSDRTAGAVLGYTVVVKTTVRQEGDNRAVTTKKLAPALDCFPLYDSTVLQDGAGRTLATVTRTVTAVIRSEPDRADLTMGRDYTERRPSEAMVLHLKLKEQPCPGCAAPTHAALDQVYDSRAVAPGGDDQK